MRPDRHPALDDMDLKILSALQAAGPLSKARLAEQVNLSPTPCWNRVMRLKEAGLIAGYATKIALDRLGDFTSVIVCLSLRGRSRMQAQRFVSHILKVDEVIECSSTDGGMDYIMKVICGSLADFLNLMEDLLDADIGIENYVSYILTGTVKSSAPDLRKLSHLQRA